MTEYVDERTAVEVSPETDSRLFAPSSTLTSWPPRTGRPSAVCWNRTTDRPLAEFLHGGGPQVARG